LLAVCSVSKAAAQQDPSPDSLVAYWLKQGNRANWSPANLFVGCPALQDWQRRGIDLLMVAAADLSPERTREFAITMSGALRCNDPRLNQWYFDRVDAAMRRGDDPHVVLGLEYWTALANADSPGLRAYLRTIMLDASKSEAWRSLAGGKLLLKLEPEERLREYLDLFETRQAPFNVYVGITELLLKHDADRLLREVGARVRQRPVLAEQPAFTMIAESSDRFATLAARRGLASDLEAGLQQPGVPDAQRAKLGQMARFLREPRR
jgi:hypothetical protein